MEIRADDEIVLWKQVQGMATSEGYTEPLAALVEAIEAAQIRG